MRTNYTDIIAASVYNPKWYDEAGVPRFCEFNPYKLANMKINECCLMEIACQNCDRRFVVAISCNIADQFGYHIAVRIRHKLKGNNILHYGDPPNIGCCDIGHTMTSIVKRVVEYYTSKNDIDWIREKHFEVEFDDE